MCNASGYNVPLTSWLVMGAFQITKATPGVCEIHSGWISSAVGINALVPSDYNEICIPFILSRQDRSREWKARFLVGDCSRSVGDWFVFCLLDDQEFWGYCHVYISSIAMCDVLVSCCVYIFLPAIWFHRALVGSTAWEWVYHSCRTVSCLAWVVWVDSIRIVGSCISCCID